MRMTTKQAAQGKWDGIIASILGENAVSRKHTACPICGGEDRYRYDNNRNDGDWFCNHCGTGDGFKLLMETLGIDFAEAAKRVDSVVGNIEAEAFKPDIDIDRRRQSLNDTWAHAKSPKLAAEYLTSRGIPAEIIQQAKDLRGHKNLRHVEAGGQARHTYRPAMVGLIRNDKGVPISIHRTYFGEAKEKKIMPTLENIAGACVRLGEPDDTLVIAEGIETALAAWAITGHPAWATISAHGMAEFKGIPRHVKKIIICADNDASFTGQEAAFACAKYMKQRVKVETIVTMPNSIGCDMLDVLCQLKEDEEFYTDTNCSPQIMRWAP